MNVLLFMIPGAMLLALAGLAALVWSVRSGQYEDPAGAAARVLIDDDRPT
jgi:cbb3-type cytochrome oxidase maturation protein